MKKGFVRQGCRMNEDENQNQVAEDTKYCYNIRNSTIENLIYHLVEFWGWWRRWNIVHWALKHFYKKFLINQKCWLKTTILPLYLFKATYVLGVVWQYGLRLGDNAPWVMLIPSYLTQLEIFISIFFSGKKYFFPTGFYCSKMIFIMLFLFFPH